MNDSEQYLLRWRGRTTGPFPMAVILQKLDEHEIGVWHEIQHRGAWQTVEEFLMLREQEQQAARELERQQSEARSEIGKPAPKNTPPAVPSGQATQEPRALFRPKSMTLFSVLGLTLGFLGAHNFYAGYRGTAVAQLLLTLLTWGLGFGIFVVWLWAMIELLAVHTDGRGVRLA
ncbi:MAG: TM2 domain-containing protein [Verrucomicrobiales bacterium]|nr:TM2 domain-containing protein [Verrucomicrobiales bacterium]